MNKETAQRLGKAIFTRITSDVKIDETETGDWYIEFRCQGTDYHFASEAEAEEFCAK